MRMPLVQFHEYAESIRKLKEKYRGQIEILLGLECEYYPRYLPWLRQFLIEEQVDYIILGNHYYESDEIANQYYGNRCKEDLYLQRYVEGAIAAMESGLYAYMAHPDLFMRGVRYLMIRRGKRAGRFVKRRSDCRFLWSIIWRVLLIMRRARSRNIHIMSFGKLRQKSAMRWSSVSMHMIRLLWKERIMIGRYALI